VSDDPDKIITADAVGFIPGMEINSTDSCGNTRRWIVVGVAERWIGLRPSTWWRRMVWRFRRLFT
jgi:hypothetical protein